MGFFKIIQFLMPLMVIIGGMFDLSALNDESFKVFIKEKFKEFRDEVGKISINKENVTKFVEIVKLIKQAGGIDNLHEFLQEADQAGVLTGIKDMFPEVSKSPNNVFDLLGK